MNAAAQDRGIYPTCKGGMLPEKIGSGMDLGRGLFRFMREKKWTFDPQRPKKYRRFCMRRWRRTGVCREQVKLVFPGDYSPELFRLDFYGVATGETLYLLGGIMTLSGGDPAGNSLLEKLRRGADARRFSRAFGRPFMRRFLSLLFPIAGWRRARRTCFSAPGAERTAAEGSLRERAFQLRQEMQYAAKYLNALLRDGEIVPDKDYRKKELCCPKCGNPLCRSREEILPEMSGQTDGDRANDGLSPAL